MDVDFRGGRTWLSGRDVGEALRSEPVGVAASRVAARPAVRSALLNVEINLHTLEDALYIRQVRAQVEALTANLGAETEAIMAVVNQQLA